MRRRPAVAGYFYSAESGALRSEVEKFILPGAPKRRVMGAVVPHAGFMYSGPVAGAVYSSIELPDNFILIGPNHTGLGAPLSLMVRGDWETPLGIVKINEDIASALMHKFPRLEMDSLAHMREHSLEVQLPFIQYFKKTLSIVPIQMMDVRLETCRALGHAVAEVIRELGWRGETGGEAGMRKQRYPEVLIIASSDMSHYVPAETAREKDFKAIQKMLDIDPEGLYRVIRDLDITMCGFGPAVAMLYACKGLGAERAELIKYANSGDASGDHAQVVGYAGVVVE